MTDPTRDPPAPIAQRPQGFFGALFGYVMEWMNERAYTAALQALAPRPAERFLEIGFGTGRCIELLLATPDVFVAGLDPTPTMVARARDRLAKSRLDARTDLREGSDESIPWPDQSFNGALAIHSFQFWKDPERSLCEVARVLRPGGRLILVFRDHSKNPPAWLPNPISKSGQEIDLTLLLLNKLGFKTAELAPAGSSRIVRAELP